MSTVSKLVRISDRLEKTRSLLERAYMAGQVVDPPSERDALLQVLEEARRYLERAASSITTLIAAKVANHGPNNPDLELMRLGERLSEAWDAELKAYEAIEAKDGTEPVVDWKQAFLGSMELVEKIDARVATTLDGLRVKALACWWCTYSDPPTGEGSEDQNSIDVRLAADILRGLLTIAGQPAARAAVPSRATLPGRRA